MRLLPRFLAMLLTLLVLPVSGMAETYYKWVDKDGITHYSKEKPTDRPSEETLVMRSEGQAPAPTAPDPAESTDQTLPDGSEAPVSKAAMEFAAAREKAAACMYATGGLKIAERFLQASRTTEEAGSAQDPARYRQEADQMRQMMSQNCAPTPSS